MLQILFLNKLDLFKDKILHSSRHLRYYFHDYTGKTQDYTSLKTKQAVRIKQGSFCLGPDYDVDTAAMYIQHLYLSKVTHKGRVVYPHFTTATDTRNVQIVFRVVMDTIVRENLAAIQML